MPSAIVHPASKVQGLVRWGGLLAGPILAAMVYMLLPGAEDGLTQPGRATAAAATLMGVWWMTEALPLPATALMPLALFPMLGVLPIDQAASRYAHPLIFLFMGGFLLGLGMKRWGLHTRIALTTILLAGTAPRRLIAGFMLATAALSMFVSNTATTIMLVPIALSVVDLVVERLKDDDERSDDAGPFAIALLLGIAYSASIGGMGTLIGSPPNAILAGFLQDTYGVELTFVGWMTIAMPLVAVFLPVAWIYLTFIAHPVRLMAIPGGRELIRSRLNALGPMNAGERVVLVVFCLTALAWIVRPQLVALGEAHAITPLASLTDTTIAMTGGLLLFLIPVRPSKREFALDWKTANEMPWGVLLLFGGGLTLARAMGANGVDTYIGSAFTGADGLPLIVLIGLVAFVVTFLTELTSNTAVTSALLPVLAGVGVELAMDDPSGLLLPAALAASCAFMLPVATPPNAIVFASGRIEIGTMARAGLVMNLLGVFLITLLVRFVAPPLLAP